MEVDGNRRLKAVTAFNQLKTQLEAARMTLHKTLRTHYRMRHTKARDTEFAGPDMAKKKAEDEARFIHLQERPQTYRKRVEKHLASVSLHAANFKKVKQKKALKERDEKLARLKKVIENFESQGPCAMYEELKESMKQRRSDVQPA
ncbi:hypothetical protein GN244_ATG03461 [Phytophthora infestans]|uniref:Uncharacterized protein n=1 Tax=Phytophthora infestans TaxID=4787 RepID=A0A833WKU7_PHYIN|nr:hypothetical protein GN244_ATG03461 [Phytophthora infestans]